MSSFGGKPAKQFGNPWGNQPSDQDGGRVVGKPIIYAPQPLLWFGRQTIQDMQSIGSNTPIPSVLILINYGDADWKSHLKVNVPWLSVGDFHNLIIPADCIMRLPVQLVVEELAKIKQSTLKEDYALTIENLVSPLNIRAWLYLTD